MKFDFKPFFKEYEVVVQNIDKLVNKILKKYPHLIGCQKKCCDCCYAIFDLTLIEAIYINHCIKKIDTITKEKILEVSNKIDRKIHIIKRKAQQSIKKKEKSLKQVMYEMSTYRIQCPLLNFNKLCEIYSFRPITCRVYGIPISFSNQGHSCGFSKFKTGISYPTINLDNINKRLYSISEKMVQNLGFKYSKLDTILMPISMAVLMDFEYNFFGVKNEKN